MFSNGRVVLFTAMFPYRQPFPMGPARRFMPVYSRRSRDIVPLGPPRNANPYSIRPVSFNPLSGIGVPGGGATLILLHDGRKMVVPSAAGAARGQRAMLLRRDSAIAGAIPVTNRVAARLHNTVALGIGHKRFRVMGLLPERATSMLARAAPITPLIRTYDPMMRSFY